MLEIKKRSLRRKIINVLLKFKSLNYKGIHLKKHNIFESDIQIGDGTRINGHFKCKGVGKVSIGNYCAFGENIRLITSNHNLEALNIQGHLNKELEIVSEDYKKKDIRIGNNVWIGDNVIILPGITIGDCAIIGAGAVVTKNIVAFSINAGNPSRQIKFRYNSEEVRELLKGIKWWDWPMDKIKANKIFFTLDFNRISLQELKIAKDNLV